MASKSKPESQDSENFLTQLYQNYRPNSGARVRVMAIDRRSSLGKRVTSKPRDKENLSPNGSHSRCESHVTLAGKRKRASLSPSQSKPSNNISKPQPQKRQPKKKECFIDTILKSQENFLKQLHSYSYFGPKSNCSATSSVHTITDTENTSQGLVWKQRQRDREAARAALEEMEKNACIEDNLASEREFLNLIGLPTTQPFFVQQSQS